MVKINYRFDMKQNIIGFPDTPTRITFTQIMGNLHSGTIITEFSQRGLSFYVCRGFRTDELQIIVVTGVTFSPFRKGKMQKSLNDLKEVSNHRIFNNLIPKTFPVRTPDSQLQPHYKIPLCATIYSTDRQKKMKKGAKKYATLKLNCSNFHDKNIYFTINIL